MSNLRKIHKYHFIYKIVNIINNKCYVGFHATNKSPENSNYFGSGIYLKKAIKKYGKNNFLIEIIEHISIKNWREKEIYWIKKMKSHVSQGGYNLTWGGDGTLGNILSNESKNKIRQKASERKLSQEHKDKLAEKRKGKTYNEIFGIEKALIIRKKISQREYLDETKEKIRNANLGKRKFSIELVQKIKNDLPFLKYFEIIKKYNISIGTFYNIKENLYNNLKIINYDKV